MGSQSALRRGWDGGQVVIDFIIKGPSVIAGPFYQYLLVIGFIHFTFTAVISIGSSSMPLFDTEGSVHELRLKQQGLRLPAFIFESATPMRFLRVSKFLVEPIQRIHSQRAMGVISFHVSNAVGEFVNSFFKSAGTFGSGHSLIGSISIVTVSPLSACAAALMFFSTLSQ